MKLTDDILNQWDDLAQAIDRVETALPSQMTPAILNLVRARREMRDLLFAFACPRPAGLSALKETDNAG